MSAVPPELSDLMPWALFRDALGENIEKLVEGGENVTIRAELWFRDMVNPMGRQYQHLEIETDYDLEQGDVVIAREQRFSVREVRQSTYANSKRFIAANEIKGIQ